MFFLILGNTFLPGIASNFTWVMVNIYKRRAKLLQSIENSDNMRTSISRDLCDPLFLHLLILTIPPPPINPLLFFLVPYFLVSYFLLNSLSLRKSFPFRRWFRFWQRLCTW